MEKYNPKVSIIIPAYNASNYLEEAINSALNQTYQNTEIIVVNDGSNDNGATEKIALSYGKKIRYFCKKNGGSSSAMNIGIKNMSGEWFSWLSHDDLYYSNKIEKQIEYINKLSIPEEKIDQHVFFSGSEQIDEQGKCIWSKSEKELLKTENALKNLEGNEWLIAEPTKYLFHGCSCLIHKSVFNKIGGFDENLRLLNDVDLWYRIYSNNYTIHYIPEILVKGRVHPKQISTETGYSYHNAEQDMYWKRSLDWLQQNYPQRYELFYLYGRNAYLKTRTSEGDKAFYIAKKLFPQKRFELFIKRFFFMKRAQIKSLIKKTYLTMMKKRSSK